ncbi:MAG: hypothetical protein EPO02_06970 [Nitrospirae bacterium]|nr:MAG: hypothetical protein EPO02_06970 [Nitrospirota bacterium]
MMTDGACTPPLSPETSLFIQAKGGGTIAQALPSVKRVIRQKNSRIFRGQRRVLEVLNIRHL